MIDRYLVLADYTVLCFVSVSPVNVELLSPIEKKGLIDDLTSSLSGFDRPWKFYSISRPVDVNPMKDRYMTMLETAEGVRAQLITDALEELKRIEQGQIVERQFVFSFSGTWEHREDTLTSAVQFVEALATNGIHAEIMSRHEIIRMLGVCTGTITDSLPEDLDFAPLIPAIREDVE